MTDDARLARRWERYRRGEDGQTIVLAVVAMVVLLGMAGLAIDVGNAWLQKRRLQAAVDIGLLSGAQKLPDATTALTDAQSYTNTNFHMLISAPVNTSNSSTSCMVSGCASPDKISMTATTQIPTFFVRLFGINHWTISASGAACGPCDSSSQKFDVIVALDRSYSMCTNDSNVPFPDGRCDDLINAVNGIAALEGFFDPNVDRLGLVEMSSSDSASPVVSPGTSPCDGFNTSDLGKSPTSKRSGGKTTTTYYGSFYNSVGDFMTGSSSSHDSWLIAPLAGGFKKANGTPDMSAAFNSDLSIAGSSLTDSSPCLKSKLWTPIAPAIQAAAQELESDGRDDAQKVIIYFGDGGADVTPQTITTSGNYLGFIPGTKAPDGKTVPGSPSKSWYSPLAGGFGSSSEPCHDAVAQSQAAQSAGITVYTIGYDLHSTDMCYVNEPPGTPGAQEAGITAEGAMEAMASSSKDYYQQATAGDVEAIFQQIGHSITSGGTRLVQ